MLNWSWSGRFLAINEAPFIIGSLSLRGFTMSVVLRRLRRGDVALPRLPHETRRLSCGRVDGVEAAWPHEDAIAATPARSSFMKTPRRYREMMDVSRRKDGAFDGRAKRPSRPNKVESCTCALYSVASAAEGRGTLLRSQGRSRSTRASVPKYVPMIDS